jgi:hypothetical protein
MKQRQKWVKSPSGWIINKNGLLAFDHTAVADHAAALMCLAVIAHEADEATGVARVTYDQFEAAVTKSRSIISRGLSVLKERELIHLDCMRSLYALSAYDPMDGWAKFPCSSLYKGDTISFFSDCTLRKRAELDALKLIFLISAFRDNVSNVASISYDKITERAGIPRDRIKPALGLLAVNGLAYPELMPSSKSEFGVSHGYRLTGIESHVHAGTLGRKLLLSN